MLSDWREWAAAYEAGLAAVNSPWAIAFVLALTTLLLEDLAIAAGVALAAQGAISWQLSLAAVAGGIAAGDVGLYALGLAATRISSLQRRLLGERSQWASDQLDARLGAAVLLARIIPGLRLVTYTASGFLRVSLPRFCAWVVLAVALWTLGLYAIGAAVGSALVAQLGISPPLAVALPILVVAAAAPLMRFARQTFKRPAA